MLKKSSRSKKTSSNCNINSCLSAKQVSIMFITFLIVHLSVVFLVNSLFPGLVVLGTHVFSATAGLFVSMVMFTLIPVLLIPFLATSCAGSCMDEKKNCLKLFVVDVFGLWVVARFAEYLGMGIKAWWVALVLAAVISLLQKKLLKYVIFKVDQGECC